MRYQRICSMHSLPSKTNVFTSIPEAEIERYAATEEPYDKAGAYAIQGRAALWLDAIEGDYYTIMGLPVSRTIRLLQQF